MLLKNFSLDQVASYFDSAKKQPNGVYHAPCPAHGGEDDNLHIGQKHSGIYVKCHSHNCKFEDILEAVGLLEPWLLSLPREGERYDYVDQHGTLMYQTVRFYRDNGKKGFYQQRPNPAKPGAFIKNMDGVTPLPYHLPQLIAGVVAGDTILIVEGEKCVHQAEKLGYTSTTNHGGAEKWRSELNPYFDGAHVVILPDNDKVGRRHAQKVARELRGHAASIVGVKLPGVPEKGDIVDWVARGGTKEELDRLIAESKPVGHKASSNERKLQVTQLSTVRPVRTEFLWKPFIPRGRPVTLEGDPGVGKSALMCKIISHLSTGKAFPNVLPGTPPLSDFDPVNVCLLTSEDDSGDTIRPRLEVNSADCSRVYRLEGWQTPDGEHGSITMQDLDLLRMALNDYKPAMIVFDPFQAYFGKDVDMNRANQTRPVLDAVDNLCRAHNCTPLFIRHVGKSHREAIYAGLGSIDIAGVMRSILFLGQDPENETRRILAHAKMNGGRIGQSLAYKMVSVEHDILTDDGCVTVEAPMLKWDGLSSLKANDLSMPLAIDTYDERAVVDQAADFLCDLLSLGAVLATEVEKEAKSAGFTVSTLRRAKAKLKVVTRRQAPPSGGWPEGGNKNAPWEWVLPPGAQASSPDAQAGLPGAQGYEHAEREHLADLEHLDNKSKAYKGALDDHLTDHVHLDNKSKPCEDLASAQQKTVDDRVVEIQSLTKDLPDAQAPQSYDHVVTDQ